MKVIHILCVFLHNYVDNSPVLGIILFLARCKGAHMKAITQTKVQEIRCIPPHCPRSKNLLCPLHRNLFPLKRV
ncbi:hypothetical protein EI42_04550 [Thermosporothrix hazakensis]|uniref:Uncharacterized protein n=1 Tax=Thermosporothrix hazakensis TaxID=644383 RepID=A0A326U195_THEHA|nr:hypothetical protein EI42_04550 [Thermosporothrix hazakensis]